MEYELADFIGKWFTRMFKDIMMTNDTAEHGLKIISEYAQPITKNDNQLVQEQRKLISLISTAHYS